ANIDDGSGQREMDNGRLVRDNVYGSIEDDAVRRDFTANALYYSIEDFSVIDYVGGYDDVQRRLLRLIGDPEARYREDPVRMRRAATPPPTGCITRSRISASSTTSVAPTTCCAGGCA